jgi:hypothetical protein
MIKLSYVYHMRNGGVILLGLMLLFAVSCKHDIPEPVIAEIPVDSGNGNILPCDSDSVYFRMALSLLRIKL